MKALFIIALLGICCPSAFAENGGRGGDAVVCFDEPATGLVVDQKITDEGRKHVISAEPREYYRIMHLGKKSAFFASLQGKSYDEAVEAMIARFNGIVAMADKLREFNKRLGSYRDGFASPVGLYDVKDSGINLPLPNNCDFVQAVVRQGEFFNYDVTTDHFFDPMKAAVMQMHELVYYYYTSFSISGPDSGPVEQILVQVLGQDLTPDEISAKLFNGDFIHFYQTKAKAIETLRGRTAAMLGEIDRIDALLKPEVAKEFVGGKFWGPCTVVDETDDISRGKLVLVNPNFDLESLADTGQGGLFYQYDMYLPAALAKAVKALDDEVKLIGRYDLYNEDGILGEPALSCTFYPPQHSITPEQKVRIQSLSDAVIRALQ